MKYLTKIVALVLIVAIAQMNYHGRQSGYASSMSQADIQMFGDIKWDYPINEVVKRLAYEGPCSVIVDGDDYSIVIPPFDQLLTWLSNYIEKDLTECVKSVIFTFEDNGNAFKMLNVTFPEYGNKDDCMFDELYDNLVEELGFSIIVDKEGDYFAKWLINDGSTALIICETDEGVSICLMKGQ